MTTPLTHHPDDFDLLAYAGGKLRARDRGPIELHLTDCGRCVARLDALMRHATPDPLLQRLRSVGVPRPLADPTPVLGSAAAPPDSAPDAVFIESIDFHALACAENRPDVQAVCDYFRQAAACLAAAHAQGAVHGDLKLADLRLVGRATVRVTGLPEARQQTGPTPDPAGDIVALGRCFAALLTGRAYGTGHAATPSSGLDQTLPPEVYRVLFKLTATDPAKRYATMAEAADALASLIAPVGKARPWWQRVFGPLA